MNATTYPKREDYEPAVRCFLPGVQGQELELRASLLLIRDRSMATKPSCSDEGWQILDMVEKIAAREAFRSMPVEELSEVKRLLIRLISTASGFDSMWAPVLDLGGSNGRG